MTINKKYEICFFCRRYDGSFLQVYELIGEAQRSLFFMSYTTQSNLFHLNLSQITPPVATTPTRIWLISWNQPKINITLLSLRQAAPQQSKASFDCIRLALSLHQLFESYVSFFFCLNLFQVIWLLVSNVTKGFAETASLFAVNPTQPNISAKKTKNFGGNIKRFPEDFMFQLSKTEFQIWKSQIVISNSDKNGNEYC